MKNPFTGWRLCGYWDRPQPKPAGVTVIVLQNGQERVRMEDETSLMRRKARNPVDEMGEWLLYGEEAY